MTQNIDMAMRSTRITMFGAQWCSDCRRSRSVLDASGVDYEYIDLEVVANAAARAQAISGRSSIPVILFPDGTHIVEPSDTELRSKLEELSTARLSTP